MAEQTAFGEAYAKAILEYIGVPYCAKKLYRVQVGAYSNKANAETMKTKLKAAGFEGYIV